VISDEGLEDLAIGLGGLTSLNSLSIDLGNCQMVNKNGFRHVAMALRNLVALRRLQLIFVGHYYIDDILIETLSSNLSYLQKLTSLSLNLSYCSHITDGGVECLISHIKCIEILEELRFLFVNCFSVSMSQIKRTKMVFAQSGKMTHFCLDYKGCQRINRLFQYCSKNYLH